MNNFFFLVNSKEDLEISLNYIKDKKIKNFEIISLSDEGSYECEKKKNNYIPISKFTKLREITHFGKKNMKNLHKFCNMWDIFFSKSSNEIFNTKIKPFKFEFYFLKILIDTISLKILLLENFLKKYDKKNNKIFYVINSTETSSDFSFLIDNKKNIYASLLNESVIKNKAIKLKNFDNRTSIKDKGNKPFFKNLIKKNFNKFFSNSKKFVVMDYGHDIKYLIKEFNKKKIKQYYLLENSFELNQKLKKEFTKLWSYLRNNRKFTEFFSFKKKNYFKLIENQISFFIKERIPQALNNYSFTKKDIEDKNIKFVISGSINLGIIKRSIVQAFKNKRIPVIIYTEGSGYGSHINPLHDNTEFLDSEILFFYGKGNIQYYKNKINSSKKKLFYVGSVKQSIVNKRLTSSKIPDLIKSIMYVSTNSSENRFTSPYNVKPAIYKLSSNIKILDILSKLPKEITKFVKPHNNDKNLKKTLQLPKFKDLNYLDGKFENHLEKADLFILDFPSTVLLEALNTKSLIFLLMEKEQFSMTKEQLRDLSKRVFIFKNLNDLEIALENLIFYKKKIKNKNNNSYLYNYSLPKEIINPKKNIVDKIINNF